MANTPKIDRARVLELWRSGLSVAAIAARMGCAPNTVRRIVRKEAES